MSNVSEESRRVTHESHSKYLLPIFSIDNKGQELIVILHRRHLKRYVKTNVSIFYTNNFKSLHVNVQMALFQLYQIILLLCNNKELLTRMLHFDVYIKMPQMFIFKCILNWTPILSVHEHNLVSTTDRKKC